MPRRTSKWQPKRWLVLGVLFAKPILAEDLSVAKAREYFRAGAQAYSVGEYGAAIQAFEQAYALAPRPAVEFSIAQAERRQYFVDHDEKHLRRSVEMFRRYLLQSTQSGRKADAVQALSELEPMLARLSDESEMRPPAPNLPSAIPVDQPLVTPAPPTRIMIYSSAHEAEIVLDAQAAAPSPLVREVEPGEHLIRIAAPGYRPSERRIIAISGELVSLDVPLVEQPALLEVIAPSDAQLSIDGRVQGRCPFPRPIELASGVHLITITKNGFVGISREETLVRGKSTVVRVPLRRTRQRTAAMFALGASASSLIAGGIFGYFALNQQHAANDFLRSRGTREVKPEELDQYNNSTKVDRDRLRNGALTLTGIGIGLGLTSALLWLSDSGSVETVKNHEKAPNQGKGQPPHFVAQPSVGPDFVSLGLSGRF